MALSEAYKKAAKDANRVPVTVVSIESADGITLDYSSQADWDGSATLTNVDTDTGAVVPAYALALANHGPPIPAGDTYGAYPSLIGAAPFDLFVLDNILSVKVGFVVYEITAGGAPGWPFKVYASVRLDIYDAATGGSLIGSTDTVAIVGDKTGTWNTPAGGPLMRYSAAYLTATAYSFDLGAVVQEIAIGGSLYVKAVVSAPSFKTIDSAYDGVLASTSLISAVPKNAANCQVVTSVLAFDTTPTTSPIFSADDTRESGAAIEYSIKGGSADPPTVNLGAVVDGDTLTPYKYYEITAVFSTTTGGRGILNGLSLNEGVFKYLGSHEDFPFSGVKAVLTPKSMSVLSQKIDPNKGVATTGQIGFKALFDDEMSDILATGYLAGKDVRVWSGFLSLASLDDFRPILTGTWQDYDLDHAKGVVTVKLRDMLKQFAKRQLPEETYNASTGAKTSAAIVYSNTNIVAVIKNIFDRLGIRGRYGHPDYDTLEAGALSASDYNVTRTITEPEDAAKLLDQAAQTAGLFLVPGGDGRLAPKLFDPSAAPVVTLDVRDYKAGPISGNQGEFITRSIARYNPAVADPSDTEDYSAGYMFADDVAETLYSPEKGTRTWLDFWKVGSVSGAALSTPPQALIDWCARQRAWFSEPRATFELSEIPPYIEAETGEVVGITGLQLPIPRAAYAAGTTYATGNKVISAGRVYRSLVDSNTGNTPASSPTQWQDENITSDGLTDNKPFLVTAFEFNPNDAMIKLALREQARA